MSSLARWGNYSARSHDRDSDQYTFQYTFRSAAPTGIRYSTSAAELADSSSQIQSWQTTILEGIFHRSETGNHQELAAEPFNNPLRARVNNQLTHDRLRFTWPALCHRNSEFPILTDYTPAELRFVNTRR